MREFNAIMAIADISGYTRFIVMHRSSVVHAEQIVSELMETVTRQAAFPLKLHKLEGDAAFLVAEVSGPMGEAANDVMRQVVAFMAAFQDKKKQLFDKSIGGCACTACQTIETLGLKTVVHSGTVIEKDVGGLTELAGEPVIVAHRLLKNSIEDNNYILASDAVALKLTFRPYPNAKTFREKIEDVGSVDVTAYYPGGQPLSRGGVRPFTRPAACAEAVRLFAARFMARIRSQRHAFQNLPK